MNSDRNSEWAALLKVVAHPVRLMILSELLQRPKCVSVIGQLLEVRQPKVSQHLRILKHGGLVDVYEDGAFRCYYLRKPGLVKALFRFLERDYPVTRRPARGSAARHAT
jgi:ArsR family transcriptional regulator